jgi:hypothetical protein
MTVGYLFSGVLGHLPLLAVLIAGFVLIAARRARLGPRSVLFARLGLGALVLGSLLQIAWTLLIPVLYSRLDYSATRYGLLFSGVGLVTALVSAVGVGLLIAAVVTRSPGRRLPDSHPAAAPTRDRPSTAGSPSGPATARPGRPTGDPSTTGGRPES